MSDIIKGMPDAIEAISALDVELDNVEATLQGTTQEFNSHVTKIASTTELGHVKVDGDTVLIDENGVISSKGGGSDQTIYTATSTDGVNYTVTLPDVSELYAGLRFYIKPSTANTGSARLDVNGTGGKFITHANANPLNTAQFSNLGVYDILYNGGQYQVMNSTFGMLDSYDSTSATVAPTAKALNSVYKLFNPSNWVTSIFSSIFVAENVGLQYRIHGANTEIRFRFYSTVSLTANVAYQITTLPSEMRPNHVIASLVYYSTSGSNVSTCTLVVKPTGAIEIIAPVAVNANITFHGSLIFPIN